MGARFGDLGSIDVLSGVSETTGEGYVQVTAHGRLDDDAVVLLGQLSPAELRAHALVYLEAAEGAETDAAVWAELTEAGAPVEAVAALLGALRARRG